MAHSDFIHLHVHTQYSLLDGACQLNRLVEKAVKFKLPGLAITDHGNLFGAIKFYEECMDAGIKPIIGCEVYVAPDSRFKKDYKTEDAGNYHLILLAKDDEGYKNLIKLVSLASLEGFYYKPRIDKEILSQYNKGLIGLSACLKGEIASAIVADDIKGAYKKCDEYLQIFGKGNFYLEIMENGLKEQTKVNEHLIKISKELDVPLVATNDIHYLEKNESFAHEVLLCIQTQTTLNDTNRFKFNSDTFYFRSPDEMKVIFKEVPQAIKNTLEIMQKCNLVMDFSKIHLPRFPIPEKETEVGYLRKIVTENLPKHYSEVTDEVKKRLEYELEVIKGTGFASYFLIIWDLIKHAKENSIPVGPGRGSAAGSIVSFLLGITDVDPLKYDLLFERFLNPARISMPDIDMDFCYEKRALVLEYVGKKYGEANVAQIITFGTMLARAVIRDVGRAMGHSYSDVDKIAKMIPVIVGHQVTLKEALSQSPELSQAYQSDAGIKRLIDVAIQLEGLSRHASTHAAGVVISDKPLMERIPLIRGAEEEIVTGFDMESLEKTGLLKMDFLGLKTLTVIDSTVKIIKRTKGIDLDIGNIPLDDKKTFSLLADAQTIGVFQLESRGMREILRKLIPTRFEDLIAVLALYRPGPLGSGMVDDFIERKQGKKPVSYGHPKLESILKETYGIILYQEQTMQIASKLAGFSLAQADLLRKAIGKKIPEIMEEQRNLFVEGSKKNGVSPRIATQIFDLIDYFSGYGFNKCITGDTKILDALSGNYVKVEELYRNKSTYFTFGCNKDLKLEKLRIEDIVENGIKPVYKLRTSLGKTIEATANHPFLTVNGWKNLGDLKKGDRIALPRIIPINAEETIEPYKLVSLAGIISEGNTCHPAGVYFYSANKSFFYDFIENVQKFSNTVPTIIRRRSIFEAYCGTGKDSRFRKGNAPWNAKDKTNCVVEMPVRSGFRVWLEELDLVYKNAKEKFIPEFVFSLNNELLSQFIGRLWSGDGFIFNDTNTMPFYASSSLQLVLQLQDILLRLGIVTKIYQKKFKYKHKGQLNLKEGYVLIVQGRNSIENFISHICRHIVGKDKEIEKFINYYRNIPKNKESKDIIPQDIKFTIQKLKNEKNIQWREFERASGISMKELVGGIHKHKKGFRRETIRKIGEFFSSNELVKMASSDVYWDEIVSVEYTGKKPTYDLQIEKYHNFIANGIIVHNSHSTAYALISYRTAYLKANYPVEFMAALLTSERTNTDKIVEYVNEVHHMGMKVLPPDINTSFANFTVTDEKNIRFGLLAIKNVGTTALDNIIQIRKEKKFDDFFEFCGRVDGRVVNKKVLESLIKSGAMDSFKLKRAQMMAVLDKVLARTVRKEDPSQFLLFTAPKRQEEIPDVEEWPLLQILSFEKSLLGIYVTSHPLYSYENTVKHLKREEIISLYEQESREEVIICGIVEKARIITTKRSGERMAILKIEDETSTVEVFVFPKLFAEAAPDIKEKSIIVIKGKLESKERVPKVLAAKIIPIERIFESIKGLNIAVNGEKFPLANLKTIFLNNRGNTPVVFAFRNSKLNGVKIKTANQFCLKLTENALKEISSIIGAENLSLSL